MKTILLAASLFILECFTSCQQENKESMPAGEKTATIADWENLRFGAFVHFNDNTFIGKEISQNINPGIFNPDQIDFPGMMETFKKAGIKYAVLTSRHTSGFCLWDSKATGFDVASSGFHEDVVKLFVDACRKYNIKPCLYYCLWGGKDWNPAGWNPIIRDELSKTSPKEIIKSQLSELATDYGTISEFWLDMYCWCDTTLSEQEIYSLLKTKNPGTVVHFNQHVQDGTTIRYFPTDILNGEERLPPEKGHNCTRIVDGNQYYLPFEYEITSQRCDSLSLGNGLMKGSVWFTYPGSRFYPVDSLYNYIKQSYTRGGSNILLSTAPDKTGSYRKEDRDSLLKLGNLIRGFWLDR
ncbi:MAG TPA: alpha-L-fucosidase [Bacteroidales bacterium]|nr:alpha-L-fucosidase [Bacteroidales bacterium]